MSETRKITDSNLEHIVLSELKEADRDVFMEIVENIYPVKIEYDDVNDMYNISPKEKGMSLKDIFGKKMLSLFE